MAGECRNCDRAGKVFCHCDGPGLKTGAKNITRIAKKATPIGQMLSEGKSFGQAQVDAAKNLGQLGKEVWNCLPGGRLINWLKN